MTVWNTLRFEKKYFPDNMKKTAHSKKMSFKSFSEGWVWWYMPIIPFTQEA
jgi:hypothetical protein